jgi:trehalose 6-phosphate phosphatase
MITELSDEIHAQITGGGGLWLFLDYDGTLAEFERTPEEVTPDQELIQLLGRLVEKRGFRIAIISGRQLSQVTRLLPVSGLMLAGTYGIELRIPAVGEILCLEYESVRPFLEWIKPKFESLISGREGFYLEDKGWAIALHAKLASDAEAEEVLGQARNLIRRITLQRNFRILGGHKFLEIGPRLAHKGKAVSYLLAHFPMPDVLLVYAGDDDKDEEAFHAIHAHGGKAVIVSEKPLVTTADFRVSTPGELRAWLATLLEIGEY